MTYFDMWFTDKENMIVTMERNMQADLNAGYDPMGNSIRRQRAEIEEYRTNFHAKVHELTTMDEKKADRWCYYDMRKRGVIA